MLFMNICHSSTICTRRIFNSKLLSYPGFTWVSSYGIRVIKEYMFAKNILYQEIDIYIDHRM